MVPSRSQEVLALETNLSLRSVDLIHHLVRLLAMVHLAQMILAQVVIRLQQVTLDFIPFILVKQAVTLVSNELEKRLLPTLKNAPLDER